MLGKLYEQIEECFPTLDRKSCAQLCLLLFLERSSELEEMPARELIELGKCMRLKLEQAIDQYDAVTHELKEMATSDPAKFGQDQVWTLLRAIKIQDQLLKMHIGGDLMNV